MMSFRNFLDRFFKEEAVVDRADTYGGPYENTLDRLETMVAAFKPYGFDPEADEEAYRARKDVMLAIQELRTNAHQSIGINRPRHVA